MNAPYNLQRYIQAQSAVFADVRSELSDGRKRTHWMWFIFPQINGLGSSETSRRFAIASRQEAEAYLAHPILGARLRECTNLVNRIEGRSAQQIFGSPDWLKFQSCMTLFLHASTDNAIFRDSLAKYFAGEPDAKTLGLLGC